MLVEFTVGNYRSFREPMTLSLVATRLTSRDPNLDADAVFEAPGGLRLLRAAAIYGPNGSGKSNLGAAIRFLRDFALNSSKDTQAEEPIPVEPFLLVSGCESQPSHFEIVFIAEGRRYRYGFEATRERVVAEWLYHVPSARETPLFTRSADDIVLHGPLKPARGLEERTRKNALFLSVCAQFNVALALVIMGALRRVGYISGLSDAEVQDDTINCLAEGRFVHAVKALVRAADGGIDDLVVCEPVPPPSGMIERLQQILAEPVRSQVEEQLLKGVRSLHTVRKKYSAAGTPRAESVRLDVASQESEGIKKLVAWAGPILHSLVTGQTTVIDEMDARFHPLITRALIGLFNSQHADKGNAQLVFMTHDTNLLDLRFLRRDQIWFTEKDQTGGTNLYSLAEFRIRNDDASLEKDYILGKFGAIPFLGGLHQIAECLHAQEK
jgi:uncharacterized protein